MCGIAGIVNLRGNAVEPAEISRLTSLVAHRGPFGEGSWFSANRNLAFGHRRLAIIDPGEGGYQPMVSGDGRHVIVFNGEIYNFLELRRELEAQGVIFSSQSDTEVILAAWQAWQEGMLTRFNGMWALAIFDTKDRRIVFGARPLRYQTAIVCVDIGALCLCIRAARIGAKRPDQRVAGYRRGATAHDRCLRGRGKRADALPGSAPPAGRTLHVAAPGKLVIRRWWRTVDHLPAIPASEAERVERFREIFLDAVALRMRSDVPIGTCLSGGFDLSAVICTMAAHEKAGMGPRDSTSWRHAFVATFPGASNDERPMAEEAAAWADVVPTFIEIGEDDALTELDRILDDNDDVYIGLPSAAWLIYRELRRHNVTVSLDGHGADELMGGYFQEGQSGAFWLRNAAAALGSNSALTRRGVDLLRALMIRRQGHYFLRGGLLDVPALFPLVGDDDVLPREWGVLNRRLYRMFHSTVLPTILRNFDRLSMAHGIEVRMPFMDWRLVTYTMALPESSKSSNGYTKAIARQAMANLMPETIRMGRRKVGFNSPMPEWLNGPLAGWTASLLDQKVPAFPNW